MMEWVGFIYFLVVLSSTVFSSTRSHEIAKPVGSTAPGDVICPDGRHACPTGSTCCKLPSGEWGCCPIPNAVCCKDRLHCCPQNTVCDTIHGKCLRGVDESIPWQKKLKSREVNSTIADNNVLCDQSSACPDGTTCCKLASGVWGCCPIPNAVCCADHEHCCPAGTKCDTAHGRCTLKNGRGFAIGAGFSAKVQLAISKPAASYKTVICPDQTSYCPDGETCCPLPSGGYGCCPMPRANCCSDHLHCCPHGSTCDLEHSTCRKKTLDDQNDELTPLMTKSSATSVSTLTAKDVCHDKATMCVNGHRCCITVDAEWGCCAP